MLLSAAFAIRINDVQICNLACRALEVDVSYKDNIYIFYLIDNFSIVGSKNEKGLFREP